MYMERFRGTEGLECWYVSLVSGLCRGEDDSRSVLDTGATEAPSKLSLRSSI